MEMSIKNLKFELERLKKLIVDMSRYASFAAVGDK